MHCYIVLSVVLITGENAQQNQDVFVFSAPQPGVAKAKDSVTALKDQPTENSPNLVPQMGHAVQATTTATTQTQRPHGKGYKYFIKGKFLREKLLLDYHCKYIVVNFFKE